MATKAKPRYYNNSLFLLRPMEQRILLFIGDTLFGVVALAFALFIWALEDEWLGLSIDFLETRPPFWFFLLPLAWSLLVVAFSDNQTPGKWQKNASSIVLAAFTGLLLYFSLYFLAATPRSLPRLGVVVFLTVAALAALLWRMIFYRLTATHFIRRVLLLGTSQTGLQMYNEIVQTAAAPPFHCAGIVLTNPAGRGSLPEGVPLLGGAGVLLDIIEEKGVHDVILLSDEEMDAQTIKSLLVAQGNGVRVIPVSLAYEEIMGRIPICSLKSNAILWSIINQSSNQPFYELQKRLLDIIAGLIGVTLLALFFPLLSILTWIEAGSPLPLFQERVGLGGRIFRIIKFRTMYANAKGSAQPLYTEKNDPRVTRVGKILRKMHLDEWSQFIHVLLGEMSVVGPRPEVLALFEKNAASIPFYNLRLSVKPGITGWAQINQDYVTDLQSTTVKLEYDLYYIKYRSILLDLLIMLKTIGTMIGLKGQ